MKVRKRNLIVLTTIWVLAISSLTLSIGLKSVFATAGRVFMVLINVNLDDTSEELPLVRNSMVEKSLKVFKGVAKPFFCNALAQSTKYINLIKTIFREHNIPDDLAYIALIESGFNNHALSRVHAHGMWQFMYQTGKGYGLRIGNGVDERRDFVKATHAAAKYLKDLHNSLGDWYLALAAYNAGGGYIRKLMNKTGATDFWTLVSRTKIYDETLYYVPRFIAARIIARNPEAYGFDNVNYKMPLNIQRIKFKGGVLLSSVAKSYGIDIATLKNLNPHIKRSRVPFSKQGYFINLPYDASLSDEKQGHTLFASGINLPGITKI